MSAKDTPIGVSKAFRGALRVEKAKREVSYEDVVWRLIEEANE